MRANSIYDRSGNNYRYQRAVKDVIEREERKRLEEKWDDIYQKVTVLSEKPNAN